MDKSHIRTKKDDMPRMQRFELSLNDTIKLLTSRAPLDSTVIYPITRSPNKHHETGKRENLSRSYLCLEHFHHGLKHLIVDEVHHIQVVVLTSSGISSSSLRSIIQQVDHGCSDSIIVAPTWSNVVSEN